MMEIEGKRILVTGAGRGLGRALALACARGGAREVLAGARRPETLEPLRDEAGTAGARVTPVRLDVTSEDEVAAAARSSGRVDILINNAGALAFGGAFKARIEDVRREIEVNYVGLLRVTRAFVPQMVQRGEGAVVNVASHLGKVSLPLIGTYCATKAALLSLSQAMRGDLAGTGVRVITVLPGAMDTDMARGFDIPKMDPAEAALEILEAVRQEAREAPIGVQARGTFARLAADPLALESEFAQLRA